MTAREAQLFAQGPSTRDRFLHAIAERVSPDRMQALYLFPPIRSGQVETGVAVLAVDPLPPAAPASEAPGLFVAPELAVSEDLLPDDASAEDAMDEVPAEDAMDEVPAEDAMDDRSPMEGADARSPRPLVLTARYRYTLKGPDRGAWTVEVHEQADAPLATVEMVVAGVARRHDD